ncbi:septal junction protein FraD [Calothrix sp. NIES-3974]|uniref:septal junction protein FraD n=1 Tax=Calothrix sp. NIES-3974 TaxID=2005462 RepID=UPI000B5FE0CA|nr:septal junction protein FraD [Calothrix sp. NIES-3974]BAZ07656.1 hypothetical protein NIES3974_43200 [Calothrix sp. NIES-3974]
MNIIRDFLGIGKIIDTIYERIKFLLIPKKAFSWQVLIYLSLFSWLMSLFSGGFVRELIALLGWIFLIAGTSWYTTDSAILIPGTNMSVGAVITGFLVSTFFASSLGLAPNEIFASQQIVLWPTISAIITAIPEFFEGSGTDVKTQLPKIEKREQVVVLLACCMVLSCWLQLYFVVEGWAKQYPSLLADNFAQSTFVIGTRRDRIPRKGAEILINLAPVIEERLNGKLWVEEVERWLQDNQIRQKNGQPTQPTELENLSERVAKQTLKGIEEQKLWKVEPRVRNINNSYQLDLLNVWQGPQSLGKDETDQDKRFFFKITCQIDPVSQISGEGTVNPRPEEKLTVAEVKCGRRPGFFVSSLPPRS